MMNIEVMTVLYKNDVNVKKVLDYITLQLKGKETFYLTKLEEDLKLPHADLVAVFKQLAVPCGLGVWLKGRAEPGRTRFESNYKTADIERVLHNNKEPAPIPHRDYKTPWRDAKKAKKIKTKEKQDVKEYIAANAPLIAPKATEMNVLNIRPGYTLMIPSGLSEAERKRVVDFIQIVK